MDTTPATEATEQDNAGTAGIDESHADALDALAALDPADAPEPAEHLAADLARALEGVAAEGEPEQLAAPFPGDREELP